MFRNYFKIAWRNLLRQKTFSIINIMGLAISMAASLLILFWVQDERSWDKQHSKLDRLYRVYEWQRFSEQDPQSSSGTPGMLADALKKEIPGIEQAAEVEEEFDQLFFTEGKSGSEKGIYASPDFLAMFDFPLSQGNRSIALHDPHSIVLSEAMAKKYFGSSNPIGRIIHVGMNRNTAQGFTITAVAKDIPLQSSIKFDWIIPWDWYLNLPSNDWLKNWYNTGPRTYVLLRPGTSQKQADSKIKDFVAKKLNAKDKNSRDLFLHAYGDLHLYSNIAWGKAPGGVIEYVRLFSGVVVLLLLIACINFMNLATARSLKRAKEVGIRKVVGAGRQLLIWQFILESVLLAFLAMIIAIALVQILLPAFNQLTGKNITLHYLNAPFMLTLAGVTLLTGFLAGSYPAFFLSSFRPIKVLKNLQTAARQAGSVVWLRKGLVVFQFTLSAMLITGTLVVNKQFNYIQTKNLGFNRENLVYLPIQGELNKNYSAFKTEIEKMPGIKSVSCSWFDPIEIQSSTIAVEWPGKDPNTNISFSLTGVGHDFLKTMDLQLLEGRDFSLAFGTDTSSYIINELAAKRMGLQPPYTGKQMTMWGRKGQIAGVVKDFHFASLHEAINPVILFLQRDGFGGNLLVRTEAGKTPEALQSLGTIYKKFNPGYPYAFTFADDTYQNLYASEKLTGKLANAFAFIAIFISCLGLFGLSAFAAEQRIKEIGVRKVLGATVTQITALLSKDFIKLVIIALLIASPVAWFSMNTWLQNFIYKIDIGWWVFGITAITALLIALLTVSFQAIRAALANPVKSLRTE